METKLRALTPRQTAIIVLWLAIASVGSFFVAVALSGSVLAFVS